MRNFPSVGTFFNNTVLRIVLPYVLFAGLWILLSDRLLGLLTSNPDTRMQWSTYKGWAFVFVTALLLYGLLSAKRKARERAEKELRESKQLLEFAMKGANDGIWDVDLRTNSVRLSPRGCEMFDYPPGKFPQDGQSWKLMVHPDDLPATMSALDEHLSGRAPFFQIEQRLKTKSGQYLWVLARGKVSERDATGQPLRMIGTHTDISTRKQTEAALRESETRFHSLLRNVPSIAVQGYGPDGTVQYWNHASEQLYGYTAKEALGRNLVDLIIPPEMRDGVREAVRQMTGSGQSIPASELSLMRKDGSRIAVFSSHAVVQRPGCGAELFCIDIDMTERHRMEAEIRKLNTELEQRVRQRTTQLEAANKELEAFSYSVSHDLRAPLRAISGYSSILIEDCAQQLTEEGRRAIGVICAEINRMDRLIDDLLAFSQMSRQIIQPETVDMGVLAQSVFDECAAQAPGRKLRLQLHPLPPAQGDRILFHEVWMNLIGNAIKYTRPRDVAEIEIGSHAANGDLHYYVKDNGVGFDMAYAEKLFGVFQRLHTENEFEGTGVGLALVQRIVNRHGGHVTAEGKPNEGATFSFTLPNSIG